MQQIRFDFFNGVSGPTNRSGTANANAAEQSGDAFARILDQQLTRRGEDRAKTRAAEPRSRADAGEVADDRRPQVAKRRDAKAVASSASQEKPEARPVKAKQPEKPATETATCAKPSAKPETEETDATAEAAAGAPPTSETDASNGTTDTESQSETPDDQSQQAPDDGAQQPTTDATEPGETLAAETDLSLLAMLAVPLPLQALTADAGPAVDAAALAAGGNATAALDAVLAAQLAGQIDLEVGGKAQGQAEKNGLKFGAILNAGAGDPKQAVTAAALEDAVAELAKAADPLAQLAAETNGRKSEAATGKDAKTRETAPDKPAATVTPELKAQAQAAIVQPMARGAGVTWSGTTTVRNELAESLALQAGAGFAADDAEFSNWSQFLGAGAAGLGNNLAARQSAFMAQLKANLQNLPPHEQIAVQIRDAMQNGNSRLTVALHPVELGRVEVKLDIDKDKNVTATIIVDRPGTLDLLRNDAKALERALQDAGLQTDSGSLSFNLRDGQNGESGNGTGTGNGSGRGPGGSGSEVKAEVRADVVQTADGYVDLET